MIYVFIYYSKKSEGAEGVEEPVKRVSRATGDIALDKLDYYAVER